MLNREETELIRKDTLARQAWWPWEVPHPHLTQTMSLIETVGELRGLLEAVYALVNYPITEELKDKVEAAIG